MLKCILDTALGGCFSFLETCKQIHWDQQRRRRGKKGCFLVGASWGESSRDNYLSSIKKEKKQLKVLQRETTHSRVVLTLEIF